MPANLLLVGAAYQAGALPLSAAAIEWAIELNGVAVAANTAAFRWGRVAVADPAAFAAATGSGTPVAGRARPDVDVDLGELAGEIRRLVAVRAAQLADYQDLRTAAPLRAPTSSRSGGPSGRWARHTAFSAAVARGLHQLTAYKDEYEVARLLTDPAFDARVARRGARRAAAALPAAPAAAQGARLAAEDRARAAVGPAGAAGTGPRARGCAAPRWTRSAGPRSGAWSASCATPTGRWCCGSPPA